ncbi:2-C-methyl-D-erythritol 4-phosphate cytidylyltransferase [Planctomicrobium sp. SH668]|uniref:2-C-methyl-D-erythritol 4-phosphate cytidylyltransferase n=1 Tax=Planctomicrobium sp. SH668 TaxID=3448126 RepID=UPI003F5C8EFA
MPNFAIILAAAGKSSRFGDSHRKKPFIDLNGRPIWVRALEPLHSHPDVTQSIVVVSPDDAEWFKEKFRPNLAFMNVDVVCGGSERADSVQNALAHVRPDVDFVAVHDAARPLVGSDDVARVFSAATKSGAAIPGTPIASTIKRVQNGVISETVPREQLWAAQTPQVFSRQLLMEAYAKRDGFVATDEAQLIERIGHPVSVVECSAINFKITTQDDFKMARVLLDAMPQSKSLKKIHPFEADNPHLFSLGDI